MNDMTALADKAEADSAQLNAFLCSRFATPRRATDVPVTVKPA